MNTAAWISFPAPAERLSMNKKMHWTKSAKLVAAWREAAWAYGLKSVKRKFKPSKVKVVFHVQTNRNRDPHNMAPTVKAIIDGLVDAGFWPDDNSDWVEVVDPEFKVVAGKPEMVIVQIEEK